MISSASSAPANRQQARRICTSPASLPATRSRWSGRWPTRARWAAQTIGARIDPGVAVADGKAFGSAGTTPVCIVRQVGKGRAVLLNFCLTTLFPQRGKNTPLQIPEPLAVFLGNLLATAGVQPPVRLLNAQGQPVRNVEVIHWDAGK